MSWIITYAASSLGLTLLVIVVEPRLRPEWREAMLWLSLVLPVIVATVGIMAPAQTRAPGFTSIVPAVTVALPTAIQVTPRATLEVGVAAVALWIFVALSLMVRDIVMHRRLIRALDRKVVVSRSPVAIARKLGLRSNVVLTESCTLPVPIAIGSAEICLPSSLLETLSDEELEPIIAHELAHLRRRDPRLQQLARIVSLVFWWQPLNRVVARRLAAVAELRADALCSTVVPPTRLAHTLVQFAQQTHRPQMAGMPAFPSGLLAERVSHLLSDRGSSSGKGVRLIVSLILCAAALSVAPRFAVLGAQLSPTLEPLIVKASLISPTPLVESPGVKKRSFARPVATDSEPGDQDVVAALATLLNDPEKHVRAAARESLQRLGTREAAGALANDRFVQADNMKEIR